MGEDIRAPQFHKMWDLRQPGFAFPDNVPITRAPGKVTAGRVRRRAGAARAADLGPWRAGTGSGMEAGNTHRPSTPNATRPAPPPRPQARRPVQGHLATQAKEGPASK